MPELPEVETLARSLRPGLQGRTITAADLLWPRALVTPAVEEFTRHIVGEQIHAVTRRAKFLDIQLTSFHLVIHLRMSGDLKMVPAGYQAGKHDRLILRLSDGMSFIFTDARKFGRIWLLQDPNEFFSKLGPEPLSDAFTPDWLFSALLARDRQLKPLLLDQHFIAGLGNIYTDEALHLARLHPLISSRTLTENQAFVLWQAIRDILQQGIQRNGASIDWVFRGGEFQNHFRVYQRTGQPCPVCGAALERIVIGQRGTHICPSCQKDPRNQSRG